MFQSAPHFSSEANQLDWVVKAVDADVSIRASLQQRGEREPFHFFSLRSNVSIRASLQQRGEQVIVSINAPYPAVSIRASLQQRGERRSAAAICAPLWFQSAPHFSSEANQS